MNLLPRIAIVGDSYTGKTTIIEKIMYPNMTPDKLSDPTIGAELHRVVIKNNPYYIWDISGNKNYMRICSVYVRNVDVCVFVFDVTNPESFRNMVVWYENTKRYMQSHTSMIVIGNKTDQKSKRSIHLDAATEFAHSIGAVYMDLNVYNDNLIRDFEEYVDNIQNMVQPITQMLVTEETVQTSNVNSGSLLCGHCSII